MTKGFIQGHFADRLGCREEYDRIEQGFQADTVNADTFGQQIINLFAKRGFTADRAEQEYSSIPKHDWTDQVLRLPVERYLVSSGPNCYIHHLARDYDIDVETNVLCSAYFFEGQAGCSEFGQGRVPGRAGWSGRVGG
ncbi:MAG: hypothetical protein M3256_15230 [Actinomycetota bacterium]|nr:hypothetical protein [Actinomycetota bacterium]